MIIGTHALFGLGRRPLSPQVLLFVIAVVPAQHPRGPGGGRFGRRETGRSGQRGVGHRAAGSAGRLIIPLVLVLVLVGWDGKRAGAADRCGLPVGRAAVRGDLCLAGGRFDAAIALGVGDGGGGDADFEAEASSGLVLGFCLMRGLDTALA
nr:hypothetical protein [Pseudomonas kuykendallii]